MKYAVIYARYSSDRQNEMSIDGQIAECRRYAEAHDMVKKVGLTKEAAAAIEKEIDEYCIPCSKMVACSPPLAVFSCSLRLSFKFSSWILLSF